VRPSLATSAWDWARGDDSQADPLSEGSRHRRPRPRSVRAFARPLDRFAAWLPTVPKSTSPRFPARKTKPNCCMLWVGEPQTCIWGPIARKRYWRTSPNAAPPGCIRPAASMVTRPKAIGKNGKAPGRRLPRKDFGSSGLAWDGAFCFFSCSGLQSIGTAPGREAFSPPAYFSHRSG